MNEKSLAMKATNAAKAKLSGNAKDAYLDGKVSLSRAEKFSAKANKGNGYSRRSQ